MPYQDGRLSNDVRVEDLLSRMTLAEKAGLMFHTQIGVGSGGELAGANPAWNMPSSEEMIVDRQMNHFNVFGPTSDARELAEWHNRIQALAATTRLQIPVTISSDPRNHFTNNPATSASAGVFSEWPETLGLAALRSAALVEKFADIARREYLAVGIRVALHPQIDLATEPRWSRIFATFGEDADLTSELVQAYIRGFRGHHLNHQSVATMVKHFPGGGPQLDGEDPHFSYGREQVYPGDRFEYHLEPFRAALAAGASQIMPYYGMPIGTEHEEIGFALNKGVITGILRDRLGFDGIVCTDWGLLHDVALLGQVMPARSWGAEKQTPLERAQKIIEAGVDQFGGEASPSLVVELVESGRVKESRIDESARRLLREKFALGLFDDPYVPVDRVSASIGRPDFAAAGALAQRQSYTLLADENRTLPLTKGIKVYVENVDAGLAGQYCEVVSDPQDADVALIRLQSPYESRPGAIESMFHSGSLEFPEDEKARHSKLFATVPTVVDIYLDRPAVIPEILLGAEATLANYGSRDEAFLDIVFGRAEPLGKLPFDLPSSMEAVVASRSDTPFDTQNPTLRFGHGLSYSA